MAQALSAQSAALMSDIESGNWRSAAAFSVLFVLRLRRRVRLRRDIGDLDELSSQSSEEAIAKRDRPSSRSGSDATESSGDPQEYEHHHVLGLARTFGSTRPPPAKRAGSDVWRKEGVAAAAIAVAPGASSSLVPHWGSPGYTTCPPRNGFNFLN